MPTITKHAEKRIKQRLGLGKKAVLRLAERALTQGKTHAEFTGGMKRFLDKVYLSHKTANNLRVLNYYVFIFCNDTLITVLSLPRKYHRQL